MTDTEKNKLKKEINFLNNKIKEMNIQREPANNEHVKAVSKLQTPVKEKKEFKTYGEKEELIKKIKKLEKELKESNDTIDNINSMFSNLNKEKS